MLENNVRYKHLNFYEVFYKVSYFIAGIITALCLAAYVLICSWLIPKLLRGYQWIKVKLHICTLLSDFFVLNKSLLTGELVINQQISKQGVKEMKALRKQLRGKTLDKKFHKFAYVFARQLKQVFTALEPGQTYHVVTHEIIKVHLEHQVGKGIDAQSYQCKRTKPRLLIEQMAFLGIKDFAKVWCNKKLRSRYLIKQFYKIQFRIKDNTTENK